MNRIDQGAAIAGNLGAMVALGADLTRREWAAALGLSLSAVDRLAKAADSIQLRTEPQAEPADVIRDAYVRLCFGDIEGAGQVLRESL